MLQHSMSAALSEAESRLSEIDEAISALKSLELEKEVLERFCAATREALYHQTEFMPKEPGLHRVKAPDLGEEAIQKMAPNDDRLWKSIHVVMSLEGRPMTAGDVLDKLEERSIAVGGDDKNTKRENVRSSLIRKEDLFERVG